MNSNFLSITCPSCKKTLMINNDHPGSNYKCNNCNKNNALIRESGTIIGISSGISSVEYRSSEKHENMQCLLQHIERYIPLAKWEFKQETEFFVNNSPQNQDYELNENGYPAIIYKSPKCKVFFMLNYSGSGRSYATFVYYGRLHAPNDKSIMNWDNKDCYCWHQIEDVLSFLDGISPSMASDYNQKLWKELADKSDFLNSGTADIQSPLRRHASIWNKYGSSFFDLFDLNNSDLWLKYMKYQKECYDIRGWHASRIREIC